MRIISKEKDYYDSVMKHGQDLSVTFMRNNESIVLKDLPPKIKSIFEKIGSYCTLEKDGVEIYLDAVLILFCGKVYRGVRARISKKDTFGFPVTELKTFYNVDELVEFLVSMNHEETTNGAYRRPKTMKTVDRLKGFKIHEFLNKQGTNELIDDAIENRWVVLTVSVDLIPEKKYAWFRNWSHNIVVNGSNLKDFQFYKIFDHTTAYQELDMFVGGTLPQSGQMAIEIEDKYRIPQHGFDKMSFRKPKYKKR